MIFEHWCKKSVWNFFIFFMLWIILGWFWVYFILENLKTNNSNAIYNQEKITFSQNTHFFNNSKFEKIYNLMQDHFYGFSIKDKNEINDAFFHSLVSSLGDKYSEYFNIEEWNELFEDLNSNFEWIGAVVQENPEGIELRKIIEWSPAEKAWLQQNDIVLSVNNTSVVGMKSEEAVKLIRWEKGTTVTIEYKRGDEISKIEVMRDVINVPSVDWKVIENNIGYVQINKFWKNTAWELVEVLWKLKNENIKGLILDFRFNGGGFLDSAQDLLSLFLPTNTPIVTTKENNSLNNKTLYTKPLLFPRGFGKDFVVLSDVDLPIVVLVNEFSASASEIFAGAIQDYDRGILVGTKTFWKGSVQEIFHLDDSTMLKLTVAKWYTPKDKNIDLEWINPDIEVDFQKEDYKNNFDRQLDIAKQVMEHMLKHKNKQEIIDLFHNKE